MNGEVEKIETRITPNLGEGKRAQIASTDYDLIADAVVEHPVLGIAPSELGEVCWLFSPKILA